MEVLVMRFSLVHVNWKVSMMQGFWVIDQTDYNSYNVIK